MRRFAYSGAQGAPGDRLIRLSIHSQVAFPTHLRTAAEILRLIVLGNVEVVIIPHPGHDSYR
jgi:hypothetical protein